MCNNRKLDLIPTLYKYFFLQVYQDIIKLCCKKKTKMSYKHQYKLYSQLYNFLPRGQTLHIVNVSVISSMSG